LLKKKEKKKKKEMNHHLNNKANCPVPQTAWTAWGVHRVRRAEADALGVHRPYDFLGDDTRYTNTLHDSPYLLNGSSGMNNNYMYNDDSYAQPISGASCCGGLKNQNKTNLKSGLSPSLGQLEFDSLYMGGLNNPNAGMGYGNAMNFVPTRYDYGATNAAFENVKDKVNVYCSSNPYGQDCRNWTAAMQNMQNQLSYGKVKLMGNELMPAPEAYYRS